jgi:hypothetical protein
MNVLSTFGLISSSFGQWWGAEGGEHIESEDKDTFKHVRLEFNGDHLIGATSVLDRACRRAAMADPSKTKLSPQ